MSDTAAPTAPTQEVFVPSPGPTGDYPSHIEPNDDTTGKTSFRAAMKQAGLDPDAGQPTPIGQQPKKEPAAKKEVDSELPDVVLHGVKAPAKEVKKADEYQPTEEDLKLLEERPTGQIKHDHFERIQKAANFKIKAEQARVAEYEAKLKDFETKAKAPAVLDEESKARVAEYEQKVKERDELLARIAYQETEGYKDDFTIPEKRIVDGMKSTVQKLGVEEDVVDSLLHMSEAKRYKALDELDIPESARSALATKLVQYDDLQADKAKALSASSKNLTEWQAQQKSAEEKAQKQRMDEEARIFMQVGQKMAEVHEMYAPIPGDNKWNAGIEERKQSALQYLHGEKSWTDLCEVVYEGLAAKAQHEEIVVPLRKHVAKLEERLSKMTTASPGLTPSGPKAPAPKALSPELQAMETFRAEMGKAANQGFQP